MNEFVDEAQASRSDLNVIKKYYKNIASMMEVAIPDLQASKNKNALMDYYHMLFVYYDFCGEKQIAAFYAKQYINLLQELRFSIGKNSEQLEIFTQGHSDNLKKIVDTFIEIGEVDSARATLKIIKQNEFIDYLKQRGATNMVTTKLSIPPAQEAILRKIDLRSAELTALKAKIDLLDQQDPKNKGAVKELLTAVKNKNQEIALLRVELKDLVREGGKKDSLVSVRSPVNVNKKNEALIDFYIQNNTVSLIITTDSGSKSYVNKVDRIQLRKNLLELYSSTSNPKKTKVDSALIAKISNDLMIPKIGELKDQGIKSLKIRTDDLVAIAPLAMLSAGSSDLGSVFNIQIQGLGEGQQGREISKSLKAFGVTKGYREFPALPLVRDEVEYISDISSGASKKSSFIDSEFTKGSLLDAFNNGTPTVHIASHYSPKKSAGSNGRLLLGDGSTISIEELNSKIQSKISTSLVTLSACDTGLSTSNDGMSNLEGLSNVFNVKGAKNVLGTLWEVSDESTADFMRLYYLLTIKNGVEPGEALSLTQKVFRVGNLSPIPADITLPNDSFISGLKQRLPGYSHPFYWAPFQILAI
jgi:CHAT domain-containing protein